MNNSFSDQSFAQLLEEYQPRQMPSFGQVERGEVLERTGQGAWIRVGGCKAEVFAPENELQNGTCVGQEVIFKVIRDADLNAPTLVSCKKAVAWKQLMMAKAAGITITVQVESIKRDDKKISGVRVSFGEDRLRGFIPFNLLSVRGSKIGNLIQQHIEVAIEDIDLKNCRLMLNRKVVEDERRAQANARLDSIKAGSVFENAKVAAIACKDGNEYGLFVEVDGVRGLLHRSEIPCTRKGTLSSRFPVGSTVHVAVLSINEPSKPNGNRTVSFSMKAYNMQAFSKRFKAGDLVNGSVEAIVNYGAFIALPTGVDGLLHRNEIDQQSSKLTLDQEVRVRILSIDPSNGRVALSMRKIAG
ncbi:MAG: S1 RNA-binding domain-containing protein [Candidatus Obscuribacterales bacterium]|jgi:small subunit ribosomal protein S1|nr:S1 RNA-binding domain-containing protein [Candidatus Obscuribacterales bacterium]